MKYCPFRKIKEVKGNFYGDGRNSNLLIEEFFHKCLEDKCSAWNEALRYCNLCSDCRVFNVESRGQFILHNDEDEIADYDNLFTE